ncbi:unnamed protein product [Lymnaea stagnalis]|uniref:medium-chain acyl-CoA ligase n=1 Tax=Lymnaea stagnalis TaxID=6523 RepID=A0AAV2HYQ7_LYMST
MGAEMSSVQNTFSEWIQSLFEKIPDKELFIFYDGDRREAYTARELYTLAGRFANRLRRHGFKRHDVIANTLPNCPERVITDVGIILAGCVTMNGQVLLADGSDFFPSAKVSRCTGVVVAPGVQSSAWGLLQQFVDVEASSEFSRFHKPDLPELTSAILVSRDSTGAKKSFLENLRTSDDDILVTELDPEDIVIVFITSGTTGYSKLVPRSSSDLKASSGFQTMAASSLQHADQPQDYAQIYYSDRMLGWIGGFPFSTYCNGVTRVLLDSFCNDGVIDPGVIINAVRTEGCPFMAVLPLEFEQILRYLTSQEPSWTKIGAIVTGGQPLPKCVVSNMLKVAEKVGIVYGSTEASIVT